MAACSLPHRLRAIWTRRAARGPPSATHALVVATTTVPRQCATLAKSFGRAAAIRPRPRAKSSTSTRGRRHGISPATWPARRQNNLTILPDGRVLVTGGSSGAGFNNDTSPAHSAEVWNPATGTWTTWVSSTRYRGYHSTALLLPDGRVLSSGGDGNPTLRFSRRRISSTARGQRSRPHRPPETMDKPFSLARPTQLRLRR